MGTPDPLRLREHEEGGDRQFQGADGNASAWSYSRGHALGFVSITAIVNDHPDAQIEIKSMPSGAIQHALDTFEIDGGLTYLENEPLENVRRLPLYRERYLFVCRAGHRFADRSSIDWAEAVAEPLCLLSDDMQNRRILNGTAASAGLTIKASVVSNSFLAICSHLREGQWCSIVPHTFFYVFGGSSDLVSVDLTNPLQTQAIGLVMSDRSPQSPMTKALVSALRNADFEADFLSQLEVA